MRTSDTDRDMWFREMVEVSPLGIVRLTPDAQIIYANPRALEMAGLEESDIEQGLYLADCFDPEDFNLDMARKRRAEGYTDVQSHGIHRLNRKNGSFLMVEVRGVPAYDPVTGDVAGIWGMVADATAEVESLRVDESRALLQAELAKATDLESAMGSVVETACALYGFDAGCVFTIYPQSEAAVIVASRGFSDSFLRHLDWWAEAPSGIRRVCDLPLGHCDTMDHATLQELVGEAAIEEGIRSVTTVPIWREDGQVVLLAVASRAEGEISVEACQGLADLAGQVAEAASRIEAEEGRRRAVERFEAVFNTTPMALYVLDLEGRVRMWNASATRLFGWEQSELLGKVSPFIHEGNREEFDRNLQRALDGVGMHGVEFKRETRDGRMLDVRIYAAPLRDSKGTPVGLLSIVQDITEIKLAAEAKERIGLLESLGVLAGGIAHDFNNILMVITGNLSLAQMDPDPELLKELLSEADDAARKAVDLTTRLLTFSKGGAPVKEDIDLAAIINRVVDRVLGGTGIDTEVDLRAISHIEADPVQLREALRSMVTNAKEAAGEMGKVRIRTEDVADPDGSAYVRISIEDDGPGIPKGMESRIFDPYYSTKTTGSGLGLSAAHSVVVQHGGRITVRPGSDGGSVFDVFLPASSAPADVVESAPKVQAGESAGPMQVLVVDDEEMVRVVLVRMLESMGLPVFACSSGEEAVEVYREALDAGEPFSIVITDLVMPGGMNGVETADALHDIDPAQKVVISSGYSDDAAMAEYAAHGFCGSVRKPYSLDSLREVLEDCLQK